MSTTMHHGFRPGGKNDHKNMASPAPRADLGKACGRAVRIQASHRKAGSRASADAQKRALQTCNPEGSKGKGMESHNGKTTLPGAPLKYPCRMKMNTQRRSSFPAESRSTSIPFTLGKPSLSLTYRLPRGACMEQTCQRPSGKSRINFSLQRWRCFPDQQISVVNLYTGVLIARVQQLALAMCKLVSCTKLHLFIAHRV